MSCPDGREPSPIARERPSGKRRAALGRAGWAVGDQALSSLSNFLLVVFVARSVGAADFGAFALVFAVYVICLTVSRAVATEALVIRYSGLDVTAWRAATASATGSAMVFGAACGLLSAALGLLIGGIIGDALVVFGFGVMPLLLQDAWRFAFFASGRGRSAFVNDAVWTGTLIIAFVAADALGARSVSLFMGLWTSSATVAALYGVLQAGVKPRPDRAIAWWAMHRDIAPRLAVEGMVLSGAQYVTLLGVTAVAGLAAVAAVRAGQVLMNALHLATYGLQLFAVPEAVRIMRTSPAKVLPFCLVVGGTLMGAAFVWGAILLLVPDQIGRVFLGETWDAAREVIIPMSIVAAAAGLQGGALVGLRAYALTKRSLRARLVTSALVIVGGTAGAALAGAVGTAWGIAGALIVGATTWWYHLVRGARGRAEAVTSAP